MSPRDPFAPYPQPGPRYRGMDVRSLYITARDGTRLAADLYLPRGLPAGERVPTILYQTRYWRSSELRPPLSWLAPGEGDRFPATRQGKAYFVTRGYALLVVDVRGTGASFGCCRYSWEGVTVQDAADILDWIVTQPWSNGRVGGMGLSYLGTTAELLLATRHPALGAVVPQFNHPDPYTDIAMPGGLANQRFVRAWTDLNQSLDANRHPALYGRLMPRLTRGVRPVGGPRGRADLREALAAHAGNGSLQDLDHPITFRDEPHPLGGYTIDDQAVMRFRDALRSANVPVYGWASWLDAGTAQAALRRFQTLPGPQLAVIGAWNHGGMHQSSPYRPGQTRLNPPLDVQRREILRFLDACLKSPAGAAALERQVSYYVLGAEEWRRSPTWPPAGVARRAWHFGPGGALLPHAPQAPAPGQPEPADRYPVNFQASTGRYNRWWELGVIERRPVDYGDRAAQKPLLLGYESEPLEQALEIAGSPVVTLYVDSSEPDGAFYVYLEDVFPDGRIVYLTEGQLRAIHRAVQPPEASPYQLDIPYHTFRQEDAQPLVPGQVACITFGLLPVAARIEAGHRLRVSLAGHDEGTFPRVPAEGSPTWTLYRSPRHPSAIELPVSSGVV